MTHETLKFLPQLERFILPVDFSGNKSKSIKLNLETAKKAKSHLEKQCVLIIFPQEAYLRQKSIKSEAKDDEWKNFPAKLIHQTKTNVIPIYFDGKNGLLFHLFASKMKNQTLKYSSIFTRLEKNWQRSQYIQWEHN